MRQSGRRSFVKHLSPFDFTSAKWKRSGDALRSSSRSLSLSATSCLSRDILATEFWFTTSASTANSFEQMPGFLGVRSYCSSLGLRRKRVANMPSGRWSLCNETIRNGNSLLSETAAYVPTLNRQRVRDSGYSDSSACSRKAWYENG